MAHLNLEEVRAAAREQQASTGKSAADLLRAARDTARDSFDVFLSHSSMDRELILGANLEGLLDRTPASSILMDVRKLSA